MKPPAAVHKSSKPTREEITARLAAQKGQPAESKLSQQDIQAKVRDYSRSSPGVTPFFM